MKKHALVLALALTVPLVLYGIPYAYATTASSSLTYVNSVYTTTGYASVYCNPGDYATGGGGSGYSSLTPLWVSAPLTGNPGLYSATGDHPDGWVVDFSTAPSTGFTDHAYVICQSPITVAGVTAPEFGQLYIAIALGALVYFLMARRYSIAKAVSPKPS